MSHTNTITQIVETGESTKGNVSHSDIGLHRTDPTVVPDHGRQLNERNSICVDPAEFPPQPSTTVFAVERWNNPKANMYRTSAVLFAFVVMGANDAAYGVSELPSQA